MCWQRGLISGAIYDFFLISHDFLMNVLSILCQKIWKLLTLVINLNPTLPCCHFQSHWGGSSGQLSLSLHSEWLERGGTTPGVGGWWCAAHWVCISQRRIWSLEVHISRKKQNKTHDKAPWSTVTNHILQSKMPAVGVKSIMWRYNSHQAWWSDHTNRCWCIKRETWYYVVRVTSTDTPVFCFRTLEKLAYFTVHIIRTLIRTALK